MKAISGCIQILSSIALLVLLSANSVRGQSAPAFDERVKSIVSRPEFAHARFGIELFSLDTGKVLYELNSQQLFVPGSTTKLLTEGTALHLLGPDYRFHTRIYATAPIAQDGTLTGDIILVASGDPNLSNRIQPNDTLSFENVDHSYGGPYSKGLPGDPLVVFRKFAAQIAAKGLKRITGKILVDATLFPEGSRELGSGVVISPMMLNDNVIDVLVNPTTEGAPAKLHIAPTTAYVSIKNEATTGKKGSPTSLEYTNDVRNPDGTHTVHLTGAISPDDPSVMQSYRIPEPSRFAAVALQEALQQQGITITSAASSDQPDFHALAANYTADLLLAEHISLPLKEETKVTLKVSQNLHASMMPFALGAIVAHATTEIDQAGFDLENKFLKDAGLDLAGASQTDGGGGDAYFSPDFMTHYLVFLSKQKYFADLHHALPILGKDGSLFLTQTDSPAAGHVYAKSGISVGYDALNRKFILGGQALAGFIDTTSGQKVAFALFVNMVSLPLGGIDSIEKVTGKALGEIAAAAYNTKLPTEVAH